MQTKDIIFKLRTQNGLSQDELAEKLFVTRQAVSRWETGETTPNTETLKLLSNLFDVSINTLLDSPINLVCQCCGMPLDTGNISNEPNGNLNEEYCKWCYTNGEYTYKNMDDLIEYCATHLADENTSSEQIRAYMKNMLPNLNYWKKYADIDDDEKLNEFKDNLLNEINLLSIDGLNKVTKLDLTKGKDINFAYTLPNNEKVKLLDDDATYLAADVKCEFDENSFFSVIANMDFILICSYRQNNERKDYPELLIYKKR